jgi:DNA-binding transcriptional LysR family regulator
MMGRVKSDQGQLFDEFHLGDAVPEDHLARKIDAALDLSWLRSEVAPQRHQRSPCRRARGSCRARTAITGSNGDHRIQPPWTPCANNAEVLRDAAIAGRGIALVPSFIAAGALQAGRLTTCLDTYQAPPLAPYALYSPTCNLAAKVRLFIDFLVKRFES